MNSAEWNEWVRFWFAGLTESDLPDAVLDVIISMTLEQFPQPEYTLCRQKYEVVLAVLRYFIKQDAKGSSSSVSGGAVIERREKRGKHEILEKYSSDSTIGKQSSWEDLMDKVKEDPTGMIGCVVFPTGTGDAPTGAVVIGGGNVNGYQGAIDSQSRWEQVKYNNYFGGGNRPWRP
ncbi:hypothetical protein 2016DhaA_0530 [Vibrio phage ICP1]|jgi:hypothetical protein|nr:hypothetical protein [Vibrio phage JSF14]ASV42551.1 hypothetical protein [Vibrio phage JSF17]AXY82202.1 hypothetical protein ICP12011A_108 [Vibrio phage ICP1_2011_A]AXY82421.1 hypothetical protein ICP12011B_105 [Vibrio phage ICP1_2011_B]QFR59167.1 hypothetical protein ICP12017FMathbaria_107 [Vibrio phage ICP1_2017_F_Mathbaria]QVV99323.1 hypothetical protein 2015DhaA_0525 [Vibrio phage ICP1]HAS3707707.1 hypothetical protein [Vibrio cholerae]